MQRIRKLCRPLLLFLALYGGPGPAGVPNACAGVPEHAAGPRASETEGQYRDRLASEILELEAYQRRRAETKMEAFLYGFLPKAFDSAPGAFHREIYNEIEASLWGREIEGEVRDATAYAYPRGHGKTTTCVHGTATWVLHEWRNMPHFQDKPPFILIVSNTKDQARDRCLDIRDELEANKALRNHYGSKVPSTSRRRSDDDEGGGKTFKWTETDFQTTDGCRVMGIGTGSKKVRGLLRAGVRPTLIICDDLENDEHVATRQQRNKLERWMTRALMPCGIEGEVLTIVVGTILHADSLLSRLLADDQFEGWLKRRYAARWNDAGLPDVEGTHVLWPSKWPGWKLEKRRRKIGSVAFAQEYLNQAVDDLTALFKRAWLNAAKARGAGSRWSRGPRSTISLALAVSTWDPSELATKAGSADAVQLVVTSWDVALVEDEKAAQERDSDYTVGLTVELTLDDRIRVRRIYRKRGMTPGQMRGKVIAENVLLEPTYVVVENNTASMAHEIELRGVPGLPLKGHTTDSKKHSVYEGVPGLALLLEMNRIDFCWESERERRAIDVLINELHGLGMEAHDDLVMALWMAVVVVRKWMRVRDSTRRNLIGPPPTSYLNPWPTREEAA